MLARSRLKVVTVAVATCIASCLNAPALASTTTAAPHRSINVGYAQYSGRIFTLAAGHRPYDSTWVSPVQGYGLRDSTGVRMATYGGKVYNQPLSQAQYALANLNSYRLTANSAYLTIAERNAQRIVDRSVVSDGARYFHYDFAFAPLHDTSQQLSAPWYSAMAEGEALSTFTRLYLATKDPKWRTAADATFKSLSQAPSGRNPFVSYVDSAKHLWLEEYPRYPSADSENVLNGHIFATFGLLDYWQLTRNTEALSLIRGAIATVQATVMTRFRRVNAASVYSLRHKTPAGSYHAVVIEQFLTLLSYTQSIQFAEMADAFLQDYPNYPLSPPLNAIATVTPHEAKIYKLDSTGRITATRAVHFTRVTSFPTDARVRVTNGPIALRDTSGPYANWYFPEGSSLAWARGAVDPLHYPLRLTVHIAPGTFTAYKLGSDGRVVATKSVRFSSAATAATDMSATVQARRSFHVTSGAFAGYWLPMQAGAHL